MNITVPKKLLPDCAVGEVIEAEITGEEGENFVLSPYAKEDEKPAPAKKPAPKKGKGKRSVAVAKVLADASEY